MQTKDWHPNSTPAYVPIREVTAWATEHSDPWVRHLAKIISLVEDAIPELDIDGDENTQTVEEFLSSYGNDLDELTNRLKWADNDNEELRQQLDNANKEIKALQHDLNSVLRNDAQEATITHLKGRIVDLTEARNVAFTRVREAEGEYDGLKERYDELKSKFDTWNAIAT